MEKNDITQQKLKEILHYDPATGVFTWLLSPRRGWDGKRAGNVRTDRYRAIKIKGFSYLEHRLAWLYVNGVWPTGVIDHINRDPADNRIENLRDTDQFVNLQNSKKRGYSYCKRDRRWIVATTRYGKKTIHGRFATEDEAIECVSHIKLST